MKDAVDEKTLERKRRAKNRRSIFQDPGQNAGQPQRGFPLFGRKEEYQSVVKQRTGKLMKFIFLEHRARTIPKVKNSWSLSQAQGVKSR